MKKRIISCLAVWILAVGTFFAGKDNKGKQEASVEATASLEEKREEIRKESQLSLYGDSTVFKLMEEKRWEELELFGLKKEQRVWLSLMEDEDWIQADMNGDQKPEQYPIEREKRDGLVRLFAEVKGKKQENNIYRQTAAKILEAIYMPLMKETKEASCFIGSQGRYLITNEEQLNLLSQMLVEGAEIEPGIKADEASYYLCSDLTVRDWLGIGSDLSPLKGYFYGNGYTITGFGFSIVTGTRFTENRTFHLNINRSMNGFQEEGRIGRKELVSLFGQEGEGGVQHFIFERYADIVSDYAYYLSEVDFDYDGKKDLLLFEGFTGGNFRSHGIYHALVWDEAGQRYEEFPSFPKRVFNIEFNEQRLIYVMDLGISGEGVVVLGMVNGQYREVESLRLLVMAEPVGSEYEGQYVSRLVYEKNGRLVEEKLFPEGELDMESIRKAYPHLDYWEWG